MPVALMSLGQNVFYVPMLEVESPGFETLQRDSSYTWVPQGRINAPIAMQYTGPGQDFVVIEGRLFPHHFGGIRSLQAIRATAATGKPQTLMRYYTASDENGNIVQGMTAEVLGSFVVMRVRSGEKNIASDGIANMIEFQIELAAYGNDTPLVSQGAAPVSQNTVSSQAQASYPPGGA
jgi:uncharacterized protein